MCRIGIIFGNQEKEPIENIFETHHKNGSTIDAEIYKTNNASVVFSRFPITTDHLQHGNFPLQGKRYIFVQNGETYSYKNKVPNNSDSEFALEIIEKEGIKAFLKDADIQGTIFIYDKKKDIYYIIVDQLNTAGFFYSIHNNELIGASEYAVLHKALKKINKGHLPINILKNGHYIEFKNNFFKIKHYRPFHSKVWKGNKNGNEKEHLENLKKAIKDSINYRIPKKGPVAVLCSGGVDSSLILLEVYKELNKKNELHRLNIYTLGDKNLDEEESDLHHVLFLLKELNIVDKLKIINPKEIKEWKQHLRENYVFNKEARLITPNPNLNSQVRHTVMMSSVLAYIVKNNPKTKVVLTGDSADEIFAGYDSMRIAQSKNHFRKNVQFKLNDLPLNDLSRVTLASYFGCKAILEHINKKEKIEKIQPIEVRHPLTSHLVLEKLTDKCVHSLINKYNNNIYSKYLLRKIALELGLPERIAFRKKIPFNQGGTGQKNSENYDLEIEAAKKYISEEELINFSNENINHLIRLNIIFNNEIDSNKIKSHIFDLNDDSNKFSQLALFHAAYNNGLKNMLEGNVFRENMPDTNYSTDLFNKLYEPK